MAYKTYQDLKARKPFRWWHEAIIDDMLAFPMDTLEKRSQRLNRGANTLSLIINSDMFQAMYQERRRAYNERLEGGIATKTAEVANKALDIVLETLETKRTQLPFEALTELTDRTLQRLGYGVKQSPGVQVNVMAGAPLVDAQGLAEARQALRAVENKRLIEHSSEAPASSGVRSEQREVSPVVSLEELL